MASTRPLAILGGFLAGVLTAGCKDSVTPAAPEITVTAVSPASGLLAGGTSVTITGTNFVNVTSVTIGGGQLGSRTLLSPAQITGTTPASISPGARDVVVTASSHGSATCSGCFTYNPVVTVTVVSPADDLLGGGSRVTITGTNFINVTSVTIGGSELGSRTVVSTAELTGTTPAAVNPGSTDVVVTSSSHGRGTCRGCFSYTVLNLSIDGAYITQATQTYAGTVPLIADRDAFIRVFVRADRSNTATPSVRARFYTGSVLDTTVIIDAPTTSVPTSIVEGDFSQSWNAFLPKTMIHAGTSVLIDVDPDAGFPESDESDNAFPASGTPGALDVRTAAPLAIRFVPVRQSVNGLTGNVSDQNAAQFLTRTLLLAPIARYVADVHAVYTTTQELVSQNTSGWNEILLEIEALRIAESNSSHYYGVVHAPSGTTIAGLAYVGGRAAVGSDYASSTFPDPIGAAAVTAAHELGHNWGRDHAPCGGPASVDPNYPYPEGTIGVYGFDVGRRRLFPPASWDLMSYCFPQWISDYNYVGILNYRASTNSALEAANTAPQRCLLVWGRVSPSGIHLQPAFALMARPSLPEQPGPYRLEGLDDAGLPIISISFAGQPTADITDTETRQFAFAVPLSAAQEGNLTALRLVGPSQQLLVGRSQVALERQLEALGGARMASATVGESVRLQWDVAAYPMVMVRNPDTGEVLSFARAGALSLRTHARQLEIHFSDGVRSLASVVSGPGR